MINTILKDKTLINNSILNMNLTLEVLLDYKTDFKLIILKDKTNIQSDKFDNLITFYIQNDTLKEFSIDENGDIQFPYYTADNVEELIEFNISDIYSLGLDNKVLAINSTTLLKENSSYDIFRKNPENRKFFKGLK